MFTGLIREIATVKSLSNHLLTLKASHRPSLGDSIAVNGVCLTVKAINDSGFSLELSDATRAIIPPSKFEHRVHIEPAMAMGERFDGHIVQGHVDVIGEVIAITQGENAHFFHIKVPPKKLSLIAPKGSITIDGVSLTVGAVSSEYFELSIIPHTLSQTLLGQLKIGDKVNIETDLFARYISHFLTSQKSNPTQPSWDELDSITLSY